MKHNSRSFELKSIKHVTIVLLITSAIILGGAAITRVAHMQNSRVAVPAATLTVTNTGEGAGGLREAITTAETTTAADTIVFNIPPTDPRHFYYQNNNVAGTVSTNLIAVTAAADDTTIANIDPDWPHSWYSISSNGSRYLMTTEITIDGFTQPGTVPNTNASGGLNSVLRIEITNGSLPCSRIFTAFASPHVFRGLVLNRCTDGSALDIDFNSNGTRADGNYIGTDPSGTVALGNDNGIAMQQSNSISVGGLQPFQRNLISANFRGIVIASGTASGANISNVAVIGNLIGTKRDGVGALGNGSSPTQPTFPEDAISIQSINGTATNHLIQDNVIAYSTRHGIALFGGGVGSGQTIVRNRITRNSIHSNGALGIELNGGPQGADSVTPNDPCDADSGPNGLQNYPRIKDASFSGGSISIAGTLDGVSTATHTIEFYASDAGDPRGFGEGKTYLGSTTVTDGDGDCLGSFDVTLPLPATAGTVITATTTDNVGNTSEFSAVYLARPRGGSCAMRPAGQISWFRAEGNRNDSEGENYGEFSYDSANRTADYISGAVGQAFNFDSTKTLQIPDTASLDFTNAFTMEMWVSPREAGLPSGQTFFISKGDFVSINTQSYGIMFTPDRKIVNRVGNGTALDQLVGTTAIPLDAFTHIATTYDGSTLRVYVNGVLDGSQSTSIGTLLNSSGLLYIGGADINNAPFRTKVSIDEPSLYSRALSDAEVFAIFNAGSAGKCFSRMCSPLSVTTPGNMDGRVGTPYSRTLQVSGGAAPYTFQLANGPSLPAGLTLNSATGEISGNPTTYDPGTLYLVSVLVTDVNGCTGTVAFLMEILPRICPAISVSPPIEGLDGNVGHPYSRLLTASGATGPYTFALVTGTTLPAGLTLASTGLISGTPTFYEQLYLIRIQATDVNGCVGIQDLGMYIGPEFASIRGRVTLPGGRAVGNTRITLLGPGNVIRLAITNPFGYYAFEGLDTSSPYLVTPAHKLYQFPPTDTFILIDDRTVNFVASP